MRSLINQLTKNNIKPSDDTQAEYMAEKLLDKIEKFDKTSKNFNFGEQSAQKSFFPDVN